LQDTSSNKDSIIINEGVGPKTYFSNDLINYIEYKKELNNSKNFKSFKSQSLLPLKNNQYIEKTLRNFQWEFILLITLFVFIYVFSYLYKNLIYKILLGNYSDNQSSQYINRNENSIQNISYILIFIFNIFILSFFIYKVIFFIKKQELIEYNSFLIYLIVLSAVTIVTLIKRALIYFEASVFSVSKISKEYFINNSIIELSSSLILLPLMFLISYTYVPDFYIWAGVTIILIIYIIRTIKKLMLIIISLKLSIFYLFLYFCTTELIPIAVTVKYITDNIVFK